MARGNAGACHVSLITLTGVVIVAKLTGKAVIAQGGGPTAVINQSLVGAVLQARKYACIENIYGAINGFAA